MEGGFCLLEAAENYPNPGERFTYYMQQMRRFFP